MAIESFFCRGVWCPRDLQRVPSHWGSPVTSASWGLGFVTLGHCFPSVPNGPHFWVAGDHLASPSSRFVWHGPSFHQGPCHMAHLDGVRWESTQAHSWVLDVLVWPLVSGKQACHLKRCGSGPVSWMVSHWDPPRPLRQTKDPPLASPETPVWGQRRCISRWEKFLGFHSWSPSPDPFHF